MIVVLCLIIVGTGVFVGIQIKNYYDARVVFFNDQVSFCEILLAETNFNKTPLKNIIIKNEEQFHKEFLKTLKDFVYALDEGMDFEDKTLILNFQEKQQLNLFLNGLGKTDLKNHNNFINGYKNNIQIKIDKNLLYEKKKGDAGFKISICVGIAIAILCL